VSTAPSRPSDVLSAGLDQTRRTRGLVEDLIADPAKLGPDFVPIRSLDAAVPSTGSLLGWKATGRGHGGTEIADTLSLLEQAASLGLVERLDWSFRCHTFDVALDSGMSGELHLTPEPETFASPCPPRLAVAWLRGRRALTVCAELHADAFEDERRLVAAVEEMHGWGWQVVYADVAGSPGEARALRLLPALRPAYVQVDLCSPARAADPAVRRVLDAVREHGATVMALGVDSAAALDAARDAGAAYGRGLLLGRAQTRPV
jgi:hypothetical protein